MLQMEQMEQIDRQGPVFWRTTLIDADEAVSPSIHSIDPIH